VILVIDNYDSFTYNLVQYLGILGAELDVRRNDEVTLEEVVAMRPERILLSPGPCTPNESGVCLDVLQEALDGTRLAGVPIFGVCLGMQAMGLVAGAEHHSARQDFARGARWRGGLCGRAEPRGRHPLSLFGD